MEQDEKTSRVRSAYRTKEYARQYDNTRYQEDEKKKQRNISTQRAVVQALDQLDGCRTVLDMPCGTGRLAKTIMDAGYSYVGCDISKEMLDVCLEKFSQGPAIQLLEADGENLSFPDNSFDCIVCVRFLGLISSEPRVRILKEFHRVSRQYLLIAAGYFRRARPLLESFYSHVPWLLPKPARRQRRHQALRQELTDAGWSEYLWIPYKSRGFSSTTKMIGVFTKEGNQR